MNCININFINDIVNNVKTKKNEEVITYLKDLIKTTPSLLNNKTEMFALFNAIKIIKEITIFKNINFNTFINLLQIDENVNTLLSLGSKNKGLDNLLSFEDQKVFIKKFKSHIVNDICFSKDESGITTFNTTHSGATENIINYLNNSVHELLGNTEDNLIEDYSQINIDTYNKLKREFIKESLSESRGDRYKKLIEILYFKDLYNSSINYSKITLQYDNGETYIDFTYNTINEVTRTDWTDDTKSSDDYLNSLLVDFIESKGLNMSAVKNALIEHFTKDQGLIESLSDGELPIKIDFDNLKKSKKLINKAIYTHLFDSSNTESLLTINQNTISKDNNYNLYYFVLDMVYNNKSNKFIAVQDGTIKELTANNTKLKSNLESALQNAPSSNNLKNKIEVSNNNISIKWDHCKLLVNEQSITLYYDEINEDIKDDMLDNTSSYTITSDEIFRGSNLVAVNNEDTLLSKFTKLSKGTSTEYFDVMMERITKLLPINNIQYKPELIDNFNRNLTRLEFFKGFLFTASGVISSTAVSNNLVEPTLKEHSLFLLKTRLKTKNTSIKSSTSWLESDALNKKVSYFIIQASELFKEINPSLLPVKNLGNNIVSSFNVKSEGDLDALNIRRSLRERDNLVKHTVFRNSNIIKNNFLLADINNSDDKIKSITKLSESENIYYKLTTGTKPYIYYDVDGTSVEEWIVQPIVYSDKNKRYLKHVSLTEVFKDDPINSKKVWIPTKAIQQKEFETMNAYYTGLVSNIIEDFRGVYPNIVQKYDVNTKSIEVLENIINDINNVLKKSNINAVSIKSLLPNTLFESIHYTVDSNNRLQIPEGIKIMSFKYNSLENLKRIQSIQECSALITIIKSKVTINKRNTDGTIITANSHFFTDNKIRNKYTNDNEELWFKADEWMTPNKSEAILYKIYERSGREVTSPDLLLRYLNDMKTLGSSDYTLVINPNIERANKITSLFSNNYLVATNNGLHGINPNIKIDYTKSNEKTFYDSVLSGLDVMETTAIKRANVYTASTISALKLNEDNSTNPIKTTTKLAIINVPKTTVYNTQEIAQLDTFDGGTLTNPIYHRFLQNNYRSIKSFDRTSKTFYTGAHPKYGISTTLKHAEFPITNSYINESGSDHFLRNVLYEMLNIKLDHNVLKNLNYNKLKRVDIIDSNGIIDKRRIGNIKYIGTEENPNLFKVTYLYGVESEIVTLSSLWDFYLLLGGENCGSVNENGKFITNEYSLDRLYSFITDEYIDRTTGKVSSNRVLLNYMVDLVSMESSVKTGKIFNQNADDVFSGKELLKTIDIRLSGGIQLNAEHDIDEGVSNVAESTQTINAMAQGCKNNAAIEAMYNTMARSIKQNITSFEVKLNNIHTTTNKNEKKKLIAELKGDLLTIFADRYTAPDREYVDLLYPMIQKMKTDVDMLATSDPTIANLLVPVINKYFTTIATKRKYFGTEAVLALSKQIGFYIDNNGNRMTKNDRINNPTMLQTPLVNINNNREKELLTQHITVTIQELNKENPNILTDIEKKYNNFEINSPLDLQFIRSLDLNQYQITIHRDKSVKLRCRYYDGIYQSNTTGNLDSTYNIQLFDSEIMTLNWYLSKVLSSRQPLNDAERKNVEECINYLYENSNNDERFKKYDLLLKTELFRKDRVAFTELTATAKVLENECISSWESGMILLPRWVDKNNTDRTQPILNVTNHADEIMLPNLYKKQFGFLRGDSLYDAQTEENFFYKRLTKKYSFDNIGQSIVLFNDDNPLYVFTKENAESLDNKNLQNKEISVIHDEYGASYKIDEDNNKVYNIDSTHEYIYNLENGKSYNIIVFDTTQAANEYINNKQLYTYKRYSETGFNEFNKKKDNDTYYDESISNIKSYSDYLQDSEFKLKELAKKQDSSFKVSSTFIGSRIPTQSMSSVMNVEVIGFIEGNSNIVYVPSEQLWLQGSDFDIDKLFLLGFETNKHGIIESYSPFFSYNSKETLMASLTLPIPNKLLYKALTNNAEHNEANSNYVIFVDPLNTTELTVKDNSTTVSLLDVNFNADDRAYILTGQYDKLDANTLKKIANILKKVNNGYVDGKPLKISSNDVQLMETIITKHNEYYKFRNVNFRNSIVKSLSDNMSKLNTYVASTTPININNIQQAADINKEDSYKYYPSFTNISGLSIVENQTISGKPIIGIAASYQKVLSMLLYYSKSFLLKSIENSKQYIQYNNDGTIDEELSFGILKGIFTNRIYYKDRLGIDIHSPQKDIMIKGLSISKNELRQILNSIYPNNTEVIDFWEKSLITLFTPNIFNTATTDVIDGSSEYVGAGADNAKNPVLTLLGCNVETMPYHAYLLYKGYSIEEINNFTRDDAIKNAFNYGARNIFGNNITIDKLVKQISTDTLYKQIFTYNEMNTLNNWAANAIASKDGIVHQYFKKTLSPESFKTIQEMITKHSYNSGTKLRLEPFLKDLILVIDNRKQQFLHKSPDLNTNLINFIYTQMNDKTNRDIFDNHGNINNKSFGYEEEIEEFEDEFLYQEFTFREQEKKIDTHWKINAYFKYLKNITNEVISPSNSKFQDAPAILASINKGQDELRILSKVCNLNQGLPQSLIEMQSLITTIDDYINTAMNDKNRSFSIIAFMSASEAERQRYIFKLDKVRDAVVNVNILDVINSSTFYKEMLNTVCNNYMMLSQVSTKQSIINDKLKNVDSYHQEKVSKQANYVLNELLIFNYFQNASNYKLNLSEGDTIFIHDINNNELVPTQITTAQPLSLNTNINLQSFKRIVENELLSYITTQYPDNSFVKRLSKTQYTDFMSGMKRSALRIFNMDTMNVQANLQEYNALKVDLLKLKNKKFRGMSIYNIFYLYSLMVDKNKNAPDSLTQFFTDISEDTLKYDFLNYESKQDSMDINSDEFFLTQSELKAVESTLNVNFNQTMSLINARTDFYNFEYDMFILEHQFKRSSYLKSNIHLYSNSEQRKLELKSLEEQIAEDKLSEIQYNRYLLDDTLTDTEKSKIREKLSEIQIRRSNYNNNLKNNSEESLLSINNLFEYNDVSKAAQLLIDKTNAEHNVKKYIEPNSESKSIIQFNDTSWKLSISANEDDVNNELYFILAYTYELLSSNKLTIKESEYITNLKSIIKLDNKFDILEAIVKIAQSKNSDNAKIKYRLSSLLQQKFNLSLSTSNFTNIKLEIEGRATSELNSKAKNYDPKLSNKNVVKPLIDYIQDTFGIDVVITKLDNNINGSLKVADNKMVIALNKDYDYKSSTLLHELTHVWISVLKATDYDLYSQIVKIITSSPVYYEMKQEILASYVGESQMELNEEIIVGVIMNNLLSENVSDNSITDVDQLLSLWKQVINKITNGKTSKLLNTFTLGELVDTKVTEVSQAVKNRLFVKQIMQQLSQNEELIPTNCK